MENAPSKQTTTPGKMRRKQHMCNKIDLTILITCRAVYRATLTNMKTSRTRTVLPGIASRCPGTQITQLRKKDSEILQGESPHLIQTIKKRYKLLRKKQKTAQYSQRDVSETNFVDPAARRRIKPKAPLSALRGVTDITPASGLQTDNQQGWQQAAYNSNKNSTIRKS